MRRSLTGLLSLALLAGVVAYGVHLRLQEPLSSGVMGAEDPYSHVVFTKESLEKGVFGDSFHLGTSMYPPGLHALLGALVSLSGVDFYDFARFVPVAFGALAVIGMYVLAARLAGRREVSSDGTATLRPHHAAGLAAALVTAVMPEHVFRTNLLFPTALDLALLPAFLLSFLLAWEVARVEDRYAPRSLQAWLCIALFALLAVPLVFAHPWVVPLFLIPTCMFVALRVFREEPDAGRALRALALPAAMAVAATSFSMAFRWDESDTGFADFFALLPGLGWLADVTLPGVVLFVFLLALLGAAAAGALLVASRLGAVRARLALPLRTAAAALAALGLLALLFPLTRELPQDVSYVDMLGRAAIALALAGLVAALVRPTRLGDLALCISVWLFPLTALNLFDSPYWPQRTVAYLCVGVALLAGAFIAALYDALVDRVSVRRESRMLAPLATLAAFLLVAGGVAAAPATTYPWYRLYSEDQFDGFREAVEKLDEDPDAMVVVGGWQSGLMIKTLGDPNQVWYAPDFFDSGSKRRQVLADIEGPAYVIVDKYLLKEEEKGEADLGFLQGQKPLLQSDDGKFRLYRLGDA